MATFFFSSNKTKLQAPVTRDIVIAELEVIESDFLIDMYNLWWLTCFLTKSNEIDEVKVSFHTPQGLVLSSNNVRYFACVKQASF